MREIPATIISAVVHVNDSRESREGRGDGAFVTG